MVQVRSIRKSVWAAVGVTVLLTPFTQKGPREFVHGKITKIEVEKNQAKLDSKAVEVLNDPNSINDSDLIEHAGYLLSKGLEVELNDKLYTFARNFLNRNSFLTFELIKRKDYVINNEDVNNARNDTDSLQAYAATQNEGYPTDEEDLKIYYAEPDSRFSDGLRKNPRFEE